MNKERLDLLSEGLLDVREAENFSGLKKSKLYNLMQTGELAYVKIGSARRIPRKALVNLMAKNLVQREEQIFNT